MDINLEPGKYVVAVSGGVDSVALLHMLVRQSLVISRQPSVKTENRTQKTKDGVQFMVAHFDHGMRTDSKEDRQFVQRLTKKYGLPFMYDEGGLGEGASEAAARRVRYEFLDRARKAAGARAIITAHHQDDVLETAVINLIRGTGRRGLSSLKSTDDIVRPLLHLPKRDLITYARTQRLEWNEDSTNQDTAYLRNHIRHNLLNRLSENDRRRLLAIIKKVHKFNEKIDNELANVLQGQDLYMERKGFIMFPYAVAREVMAAWLRRQGITDYDKKMLERLVVAAKTYQNGKKIDVNKQYVISVGRHSLALRRRDR